VTIARVGTNEAPDLVAVASIRDEITDTPAIAATPMTTNAVWRPRRNAGV